MPVFADRMKEFTDHLRDSIEERTEALGQVHQATNDLLGAARTFMADVTTEHRERASELSEMLNTFHDDLNDRVHEMRERHQEGLREMRDDMRRTLDENLAARHEAVTNMRHAFQQSQREVADDLRAAGDAWREFAASRHGK